MPMTHIIMQYDDDTKFIPRKSRRLSTRLSSRSRDFPPT